MKLKQALKEKNQLINEITELYQIIENNNSIIDGNERLYSISDLMKELDEKVNELVTLKGKIQRANFPIFDKIFMLSELKNKSKEYKMISTVEGKTKSRYGESQNVMVVEINNKNLREIIKDIERQILKIQDELDDFNSVTEI